MRSKSVNQFCEDHSITRPTFYKEVNAGRIRVFKIGSLTRISDVAEKQYISESEQRAKDNAPAASARARQLVLGTAAGHAI